MATGEPGPATANALLPVVMEAKGQEPASVTTRPLDITARNAKETNLTTYTVIIHLVRVSLD